jgi:hypothetical protein
VAAPGLEGELGLVGFLLLGRQGSVLVERERERETLECVESPLEGALELG